MKVVRPVLTAIYAAIAVVFLLASVTLLVLAVMELWEADGPVRPESLSSRAAAAIESIGLIAVSLIALEMAQTVVEEEVVRRVHVSAPTRVRRYLSRFLVVVVVALPIEASSASSKRCMKTRATCRARPPGRSAPPPCWPRGAYSYG